MLKILIIIFLLFIPQTAAEQNISEPYQSAIAPAAYASTSTPLFNKTYKQLIQEKNWDSELAYRIMICESHASSTIRNFNSYTGDDSYGLFQINILGELKKDRPAPEELKDAQTNIDFAYRLYQQSGWKNWLNCFNKEYNKDQK